jgi:hypothetical protein
MDGGRRRESTDWRLAISARGIVAMGTLGLFMVLVGIRTVGTGQAFLAVMALSFLALIGFVVAAGHRGSGFEP